MNSFTPRSYRTELVIAALAMATLMAVALSVVEALDHVTTSGNSPWTAPLHEVDDALAAKNSSAALAALHVAYLTALGSRGWEGMIAVGNAALRVGEAMSDRRRFAAKARLAYRSALFRARHLRSLEGVLQAGDAFNALGDANVAQQCLEVARGLTAGDPEREARVQAFEEQLRDRAMASGEPPVK